MTKSVAKRVAIIGGSGFIGQSIAQHLIEAGYAVTVLDLVSPCGLDGCNYLAFDMRENDAFPFAQERYFAVIIAAGVMAKGCNEDPAAAWAINVTATENVLQHIASASPDSRIIFLSTGMVYDGAIAPPPFVESAATLERCTYTKSKLAIEAVLAKGLNGRKPADLVLRPFTVYGQEALSADRGHLFGRWLDLGRKGQGLTVYGDGLQVIDPVPVEYISEACIAWFRQVAAEEVTTINISSGGSLTLHRLAELFVEMGLAPSIEKLPAIGGDVSRGWGDVKAYESLVGRRIAASPESLVGEFLRSLNAGVNSE